MNGLKVLKKKFKELKGNKKGFTLIEIIVVLVILAILAAATVPSMVGFISDARGKAMVAEARAALIAAQAIATEAHISGSDVAGEDLTESSGKYYGKYEEMLEPDINVAHVISMTITGGSVKNLVYSRTGSGFTITLTPGETAVVTRGEPGE